MLIVEAERASRFRRKGISSGDVLSGTDPENPCCYRVLVAISLERATDAMRFAAFVLSCAAGVVGLAWSLMPVWDVVRGSQKLVEIPQPCIECPSNELPMAVFICTVIVILASILAFVGGSFSLWKMRAAPPVLVASGCGMLFGLIVSAFLAVVVIPQAAILWLAAALAALALRGTRDPLPERGASSIKK